MTKTESYNRHPEIIARIQDPRKSTEFSSFDQVKKGYSVESYFRDRKFTGASGQSIDNLIRDYEIFAVQQCLDRHQLSPFFINALADPARQYFQQYCSSRMLFDQIASTMRRHYNSDTNKLQLQSEMGSIDLTSFMLKNNVQDISSGFSKLIDHINALALQLQKGFGDDMHETRYLRRVVSRYE